MTNLNQTLSLRQESYGDFADNAAIADQLLKIVESGLPGIPTNWYELSPMQRIALTMICCKLARILSPTTNGNHKDNWHDIQGYAALVENSL